MTTKGGAATVGPAASARAQRRLLVQMSVFTASVLTFTAAWLGIVQATDRTAATPDGATVELSAGGTAALSLVPAPPVRQCLSDRVQVPGSARRCPA